MVATRRRAATGLLAHNPTKDTDDVLDFLELIALLVNRRVLDDELAWHSYYWPAVIYWMASHDYIREMRRLEGETTWQDLGTLATLLQAIEARKTRTPTAEATPLRSGFNNS